jgi:hypothetical protein
VASGCSSFAAARISPVRLSRNARMAAIRIAAEVAAWNQKIDRQLPTSSR